MFSRRSIISITFVIGSAIICTYGSKQPEIKEVDTLTLINKFLTNRCIYIIDVRSKKSFNNGAFYSAINIPLRQVEEALGSMSDRKFFCKYGRIKPSKNTPILFTCAGKMSLTAANIALKLGYTRIYSYTEGWAAWLEFAKKHKPHCPYGSCHRRFPEFCYQYMIPCPYLCSF